MSYGKGWDAIRRLVLDRDHWRCQFPTPEGVCGKPAKTAGHIKARVLGGTNDLNNLRAECENCNYRDGQALSSERTKNRRIDESLEDTRSWLI